MDTYRKFGFPSKEALYTLMDAAGLRQETEGEYSYINCSVVEVGSVCLAYEQGENGPTCVDFDPRYAVDIVFSVEIPEAFEQYVVWPTPNSAVHWFAGWESQYAVDFCTNNPNDPFCTLAPPTE